MSKPRRRSGPRSRSLTRYIIAKDQEIDYKNVSLLQKYLNERGKLLSRRVTGVTAHQQRQLTVAVKRARFLGLLSSGSVK